MRLTSLVVGLLILAFFSALFLGRPARPVDRTLQARTAKLDAKRKPVAPPSTGTQPIVAPPQQAPALPAEPAPVVAVELTPAKVSEKKDDKVGPSWRIEGDYRTNPEEARQSAVSVAQKAIAEHLAAQNPPIRWVPPTNDLWERMVKELPMQDRDFGGSVGRMYRVELEVRLTPDVRAGLARQDRQFHSEQRMAWLLKVLGVMVALLAAVAGFLPLDDMTKGYYTGWLRLAAAGFVGGIVLFLVFLA